MAKRAGYIVGGVFMFLFCASVLAQQKTTPKTDQKKSGKDSLARKKKPVYSPKVFLGNSNLSNGKIKPKAFDSLIRQGLQSRDSSGNKLTVLGFNFNYAERELVEDSIGDMHWQIEISTEYCPGDTLTSNVAESIRQRLKHGDTIFIEQIKLVRPSPKRDTFWGRQLKFEIIK